MIIFPNFSYCRLSVQVQTRNCSRYYVMRMFLQLNSVGYRGIPSRESMANKDKLMRYIFAT